MPDLFTIISLMIGLFGGSISAIIIMKDACERRVEENLANADEKIKAMGDKKCPAENLKTADSYRTEIESSSKHFGKISVIPSIVFLVWIFLTCLYVVLSPDCKKIFGCPEQRCQNPETRDPNQPTETHTILNPSNLRVIGNAVSSILYKVLFNRVTIFLIAFIDACCIYSAWKSWKCANSQYEEIVKLHKAVVLDKEKTVGYERTYTS